MKSAENISSRHYQARVLLYGKPSERPKNRSPNFYAIKSREEPSDYLEHPVLGQRLTECCEALLAVDGKTATEILGFPDDLKLRSSATLFSAVSPPDSVFTRVIDKFFNGHPDSKTLELLNLP